MPVIFNTTSSSFLDLLFLLIFWEDFLLNIILQSFLCGSDLGLQSLSDTWALATDLIVTGPLQPLSRLYLGDLDLQDEEVWVVHIELDWPEEIMHSVNLTMLIAVVLPPYDHLPCDGHLVVVLVLEGWPERLVVLGSLPRTWLSHIYIKRVNST